jgi:hypothetical protein
MPGLCRICGAYWNCEHHSGRSLNGVEQLTQRPRQRELLEAIVDMASAYAELKALRQSGMLTDDGAT